CTCGHSDNRLRKPWPCPEYYPSDRQTRDMKLAVKYSYLGLLTGGSSGYRPQYPRKFSTELSKAPVRSKFSPQPDKRPRKSLTTSLIEGSVARLLISSGSTCRS